MMINRKIIRYILCVVVVLISVNAYAQTGADKSTQALSNPVVHTWKITKSLFFLPNDIAAILSAQKGIVPSKATDNIEQTLDDKSRYVSLAGISFVDNNHWTIWINNQKITPDNIPEKFVKLHVYKDHIDLQWHDAANQRVIEFTLAPYQKFHLDTATIIPE